MNELNLGGGVTLHRLSEGTMKKKTNDLVDGGNFLRSLARCGERLASIVVTRSGT